VASNALAATFAMPVEEFANSSRRYAWYVAGLLTLTQVVSYIDRFLPSLLIQPIKSDLGLTDFQVGLLLGPAFGIFYVFIGIPIGWLADRRSRRAILSIGISIWCAMTAAAGLVRGFWPLFVARLGVGLGEATVAPCSISLISDYFPRSRRNRALSLFMAGTFLGAGAAFLFGGPVVHWIGSLSPLHVPGVGTLATWQMSFLVIGLPGFALALMMYTIREPARQDQVVSGLNADRAGHASLKAALAYIVRRWRAFGTLFVGSAAVVTMGSLVFWNVALFDRVWQWNVRDVGIATGLLFLAGGTAGTLLGVRVTNAWIAAGQKHATLKALWTGLAIGAPGFALYPVMPSAELAIAALMFAFVGQAMAAAAGPATLTLIAPGQIKSQATAIYYLAIGIAGQLLGPLPVGLMTDLFGDPADIRYAMTIQAAVIGTLALIVVAAGLGSYRRCVIEVEAAIRPTTSPGAGHG
jgi:MFS family permease